jgi:hypothetical protein
MARGDFGSFAGKVAEVAEARWPNGNSFNADFRRFNLGNGNGINAD